MTDEYIREFFFNYIELECFQKVDDWFYYLEKGYFGMQSGNLERVYFFNTLGDALNLLDNGEMRRRSREDIYRACQTERTFYIIRPDVLRQLKEGAPHLAPSIEEALSKVREFRGVSSLSELNNYERLTVTDVNYKTVFSEASI